MLLFRLSLFVVSSCMFSGTGPIEKLRCGAYDSRLVVDTFCGIQSGIPCIQD